MSQNNLPDKMPVPNPISDSNPNTEIQTIYTTDQPTINPAQTIITNSEDISSGNIDQPSPFTNQQPFQPAITVPDGLSSENQLTPAQELPEQEQIIPTPTPPPPTPPPTPPTPPPPTTTPPPPPPTTTPPTTPPPPPTPPPTPPTPPPPTPLLQQKPKYEIISLFWLINYVNNNEIPLISINYNAQFVNLRIVLYKLNGSLQSAYIDTSKCKKITTFNIFSEKALEILDIYNYMKHDQETISIYNLERLHGNQHDNWKPSSTIFHINKQQIQCQVIDKQQQYIYTFMNSQLNMFLKSLNFLINGQSWTVSLISSIMR